MSSRIHASTLTAAESREAAGSGYVYQDSDRPGELILSRREQVSVLRFSADAVGTPERAAIVELLGLDPALLVYDFESAFEGILAETNQKRQTVDVGLRSLIEMLFLVSKGVQVPQCDLVKNIAPSKEWLPLGVFALSENSKSDATPNLFLQLAVSKEGIVAGTLNNKTTDENEPVEGMLDMKSGRAAWTIAGKTTPIMETKIEDLTENETSMLVHFEDGSTQEWLMLHMEKPADEK